MNSAALTNSAQIAVADSQGPDGGLQTYARVAFGGKSYLAIWVDIRTGTQQIRGARVSTTGEVLDNPSLVLVADPGSINNDAEPTLISNGAGYLLVWSNTALKAIRLDPDARVLDDTPIAIATGWSVPTSSATAAWNGHEYLIAWPYAPQGGAGYGVYVRRMSAAGTPLAPAETLISVPNINYPIQELAIGWTGTAYQVIWLANDEYYQGVWSDRIWTARVSAEGQALGKPVNWFGPEDYASSVAIACSGRGFCLVDWEGGGIGAQLIDDQGTFLDSTESIAGYDTDGAAIAWDGRSFTAVWRTMSNTIADLQAVSLGPGAKAIGEAKTVETFAVTDFVGPVVASDGHGHSLVVFGHQGTQRVVGYLLGDDPPDGGAWPIATGSSDAGQPNGSEPDAAATHPTDAATPGHEYDAAAQYDNGSDSGMPEQEVDSGRDAGRQAMASRHPGSSGCSVRAASRGSAWVTLTALALFAARRKRRGTRPVRV